MEPGRPRPDGASGVSARLVLAPNRKRSRARVEQPRKHKLEWLVRLDSMWLAEAPTDALPPIRCTGDPFRRSLSAFSRLPATFPRFLFKRIGCPCSHKPVLHEETEVTESDCSQTDLNRKTGEKREGSNAFLSCRPSCSKTPNPVHRRSPRAKRTVLLLNTAWPPRRLRQHRTRVRARLGTPTSARGRQRGDVGSVGGVLARNVASKLATNTTRKFFRDDFPPKIIGFGGNRPRAYMSTVMSAVGSAKVEGSAKVDRRTHASADTEHSRVFCGQSGSEFGHRSAASRETRNSASRQLETFQLATCNSASRLPVLHGNAYAT